MEALQRPRFDVKKNRVLELYDLADGQARRKPTDPDVVICFDEFGPLNLQPHPGPHWAERDQSDAVRSGPRRRRRTTYARSHGVRHLLSAYDPSTDKLYGHVKVHKGRSEFLAFMGHVRRLHPPQVRIAIVLDNFVRTARRKRTPGSATGPRPTTSSWLNRIEAQFTALRYFCLDGTDHESHEAQAFLIRRYIAGATATLRTRPSVSWSSAQTLPDAAQSELFENCSNEGLNSPSARRISLSSSWHPEVDFSEGVGRRPTA